MKNLTGTVPIGAGLSTARMRTIVDTKAGPIGIDLNGVSYRLSKLELGIAWIPIPTGTLAEMPMIDLSSLMP